MAEEQFQEQSSNDPFSEFDPRVREDIDGLIWLGYLENEVTFCGHTFVLRTLKGDEELNAGLVSKDYVETIGQAKAWAWAKIALSLVSVDSDTNFCPRIGPDKKEFARARFNWVTSQWHWPVGEYLYTELVNLEARQIEAVRAIQNLSERSLPNFTPSQDSWTEQGDLAEIPTT